MSERGRWLFRIGATALVVLLCLAAWQVTKLDSEGARELLESAGPWAPILYVVSFALLEPFGVLAVLFIGPGSLIWEWRELFLLSWFGSVGASIVGFYFARSLGRDWVARRVPSRLRAYEERLERHAFLSVVALRLLFFLWPPVHWMLGLSRVRFGTYALASAIGLIPGVAFFTFLGKSVVDAVLSLPPEYAVGLVVASVLVFGLIRWRRNRRARTAEEDLASPAALWEER